MIGLERFSLYQNEDELKAGLRADKFSKLPKLEFFDTEGQKGRGWKAHRQVYE